jgi:hypothetical protein
MKPEYAPACLIRFGRGAAATVACAMMMIACGGGDAAPAAAPQGEAPTLAVLSSKAEFVSGGDALIEVKLPAGAQANQLQVSLNGTVVTPALTADASGALHGLLGGLKNGENSVVATLPNSARATLKLTNYPITGPILSGPHMTPYECRTAESGLGAPLDADCSATRKITYYYRATDNTFKLLTDPLARPADLRTTTTNDGRVVPYIVRVDSGTVNRTIYRIAILDEPTASNVDPAKWVPGSGWNRKLAMSFVGGIGTMYNEGITQPSDVLDDMFLSRGFAHAISTEMVNGLHANQVLQGELVMMLKEFFIKRYGVPKWTVGSGSSGGSIEQLVITEMMPGLLDGLMPSRSFPDSMQNTADCGLFQNFFGKADPAVWTGLKRQAVEGFTNGTCASWAGPFVPIYNPMNYAGCALNDTTKLYHPLYNPGGARCTVQDMRVNIYGRDPETGFARKPQDNVGLQYGLLALQRGDITAEEFLQLNEGMGGNDIDNKLIPTRSVGDPIAIRAAYESGLSNGGAGGLANVPILHFRNYLDAVGDLHTHERDFSIRARLQKALGRSDHQVIWVGPGSDNQGGDGRAILAPITLDTMNQWLDNMAADPGALNTDKVVRNKPPGAVDACWDTAGRKTEEVATFNGPGVCNTMYPVHSEPRLQAGAPLSNDIIKCQLKPINIGDYAPATFTAAQQTRLRSVFPTGVCDWSKPGVEQVSMKGSYQRY